MISVKQILESKGSKTWTISPDATVFDALKLMADRGIGALVVMGKDDIVGIISERDYARKVILQGKFSKDTLVREIMSTQIYGVSPDTTAEECMAIMTDKRFRHLPVCKDGKLVGVVSIGDIVKSIIAEQKITIDHLESYIMGKYVG
jgi:CBS domain-containing protein